MTALLERLNSEFAELALDVQSSLVRIESGRSGAGAGTVWHSEGLILTNSHVARGGRPTVHLSDGRRFRGKVLARDRQLDLAAISIGSNDLPTLRLGDSNSLRPGDWVFAFGHPWGIEGAATAGNVIDQGDRLPERPWFGRDWLAVALHYRPGHSGGPLVDSSGRLVGINTAMAGPDVGMAIPVLEVKRFLRRKLGRG